MYVWLFCAEIYMQRLLVIVTKLIVCVGVDNVREFHSLIDNRLFPFQLFHLNPISTDGHDQSLQVCKQLQISGLFLLPSGSSR